MNVIILNRFEFIDADFWSYHEDCTIEYSYATRVCRSKRTVAYDTGELLGYSGMTPTHLEEVYKILKQYAEIESWEIAE